MDILDGLLLNPSDNAVVCGNWCNNRASSGQQDLGKSIINISVSEPVVRWIILYD